MSAQMNLFVKENVPHIRVLPTAAPPPCHLRREILPDGICLLTFDRLGSSANIFNEATLLELNDHLNFIQTNAQLKGLVLTSAKSGIFIAGADLHALAGETDPTSSALPLDLHGMISLGQSTFNRIATLPVPTVAAIHGACLGGGLELCLACDYRVASPDRATKIGLPETQLGILPAWGGSTRLPRLIGLPKALDIILAGKTLAAKSAFKIGLVDELAPHEHLVEVAFRVILARGKSLRTRPFQLTRAGTNNAWTARALSAWLRAKLLKKTRGHYPAVLKALEVVTRGITGSEAESFALEANAVVELAKTETCRNLMNVFFLQERAKKFVPTLGDTERLSAVTPPMKRAAVIGAGVMGAGIAQWLSARGVAVVLRDVNAEQVGKGVASISRLYAEGVKRHTFTPVEARQGMDRIYPAIGETPLHETEIIIEAAVERMDLKKQIFQRLDELAGPRTILATNTSALSVTELAATTRVPGRVVGIHFFNPVHRMQLVEVIVGQATKPDVVQRAVRFVQQLGKLPVVVKDSPGFVVNRILIPYLLEAGHLFERGAAVTDLDEAMLDFGMPMGPLRLIDEVGLDVSRHVADTLAASFPNWMRMPKLLPRMVEAGLLGRKAGKGFYLYGKGEPTVNPQVRELQETGFAAELNRETLRERMSLLMVNEAARCIESQLVASADDVDFAMIMGTGFAPFRGGPLRYADALGIGRVVTEMKRLVESGALHFRPCDLLENMTTFRRNFHENHGG